MRDAYAKRRVDAPRMPLPVYVLAGGRSRRFGSDKARACIHGVPMLASVTRTFASHGHRVTAVARRADAYADLGVRTLADPTPDRGPLGGLHAALEDNTDQEWLALVSCDWAGLNGSWLRVLAAQATASTDIVAFHDGRWQPLLALYHGRLRGLVRRRLKRGPRSLHALLTSCDAKAVSPPADWSQAQGINTREALSRYLRASSRRSPATPSRRSTTAPRTA